MGKARDDRSWESEGGDGRPWQFDEEALKVEREVACFEVVVKE